jgi:palmitoyltransferase
MAWCSRVVFRCFKCMERAADRVTGAAGPFFVAIAYALLSLGAVTFCESRRTLRLGSYITSRPAVEVIAPALSYRIISVPICILFATNMFAHYYYVCTVPPGFADDPPSTITARQGTGWIWAQTRKPQSGVQWSNELNFSEPKYNRCKRCGMHRPEVRSCL